MICAFCIAQTSALQTVDRDGYCPRCGTDYRPWRHTRTVPALLPDVRVSGYDVTTKTRDYNARTSRLVPTGAAYKDRLIAARLALRSSL